MSKPENPQVLGDEYVYINMFGAYADHIDTFVNEDVMKAIEVEDSTHYPKFKALGIPDARIAVVSAIALRDALKTRVGADNLTPGNFI